MLYSLHGKPSLWLFRVRLWNVPVASLGESDVTHENSVEVCLSVFDTCQTMNGCLFPLTTQFDCTQPLAVYVWKNAFWLVFFCCCHMLISKYRSLCILVDAFGISILPCVSQGSWSPMGRWTFCYSWCSSRYLESEQVFLESTFSFLHDAT